ncbi:MAG: prepilin-type N-terminal cleavage/methylation domain-containing protein [Candidatus Rokubacteria bacterium]|nr:prepilin-type N-terminal cleavage/methylation domain-containing protein [Candidatus Rokubacteria bacterium]
MNRRHSAGFTLLEVLVAMVILSVAVVTLIQLASQGLRLLKLSSDHQEASLLADRLVRASEASIEGIETGQEGRFTWERRARLVAIPDEPAPAGSTAPRVFSLSVAVRWDGGRTVEVATLRLSQASAATP